MLNWCNRFNICCFLDNHNYHLSHHTIECMAAADASDSIQANAGNAIDQLYSFHQQHNDWIFGHLSYDLKNEIESLSSNNPDRVQFPDLFFFVPQVLVELSKTTISIGSLMDDHKSILEEIMNQPVRDTAPVLHANPNIVHNLSREEYISTVIELKKHILRGDCYEVNFCQEFFAPAAEVEPLALYLSLSRSSPNPFSAFYKINHLSLSCLSPERYLKKEGTHILSQPIKGTAERNMLNIEQDQLNAASLLTSEKERAENIMVVDLVRNDLSKICRKGTVHVDELCAVYPFPQVYQMISTVSGELNEGIKWTDAIRATFPMGSMTGAPKKKVMELIEKYEKSKRGLFSGSIGYVTPNGDFDFNVVIRTVMMNAATKYLSFHTGSAITFNADPDKEYDECLLKAAAIKKALAETNTFH